jgi:hypothetical protein
MARFKIEVGKSNSNMLRNIHTYAGIHTKPFLNVSNLASLVVLSPKARLSCSVQIEMFQFLFHL